MIFHRDWWGILRRAWSVRVAIALGAISGLYSAWPAFQDTIPAPVFAVLSMAMSVALVLARIAKQPGAEE